MVEKLGEAFPRQFTPVAQGNAPLNRSFDLSIGSRTELFGLAAEFDFDLVMTGYDLWATYATVPAAAHYDLSHSPAEHAVSALLMVWDGRSTDADVDGGLAAALGSPQTRRRPGSGTGLPADLDAELDAVLDSGGAAGAGEGAGDDGE